MDSSTVISRPTPLYLRKYLTYFLYKSPQSLLALRKTGEHIGFSLGGI